MQHTGERPEGVKEKTRQLTDHIGDLAESYYKLGVLNVTDKAAVITSLTLTVLAVTGLAMFVLLFLGAGLGWWLGTKLQNMPAGFSLVAGIFILLIGLLLLLRRQVLLPLIRNAIIRKVYE
jgi:hypothetical protein